MVQLSSETLETRVGAVHVARGGDGPPVVYFHSAQGESTSLPFLERLAERRTVIAPVFPGFGESQGIEHIDDMDDAVFHLLDVWERLGLAGGDEAPPVVGLSLGGWMAAELATRYPDMVGALVLVNPAGLYIRGHEIRDIFGRSPGALAQDLFFDQSHPVAQMMHALDDLTADVGRRIEIPFEAVKPLVTTMAATAKLAWDPYLHNPKLERRLWRVGCPTLVVHGAEDRLVPRAHAERYTELIEGARLVDVADGGHMLTWEKPDELTALTLDFLSGAPVT